VKILADNCKKYGNNEEIETLKTQENGANHPAASDDSENNNASGDAGDVMGREGMNLKVEILMRTSESVVEGGAPCMCEVSDSVYYSI
jgi:hypothetical protein